GAGRRWRRRGAIARPARAPLLRAAVWDLPGRAAGLPPWRTGRAGRPVDTPSPGAVPGPAVDPWRGRSLRRAVPEASPSLGRIRCACEERYARSPTSKESAPVAQEDRDGIVATSP